MTDVNCTVTWHLFSRLVVVGYALIYAYQEAMHLNNLLRFSHCCCLWCTRVV